MTATHTTHPRPAALRGLRATDFAGVTVTTAAMTATAVAVWLSTQNNVVVWVVGQLLLAGVLVEWFVILHECGHTTLFRTRWPNLLVGQLAGVFALIPFSTWRRVHGRHHKWTGWQDLDPTTAALTPRARAGWQRTIVNVCWKYWIPLFSVLYRLTNFWHIPRLCHLFPDRVARQSLVASSCVVASIYIALSLVFGPVTLLRIVGLSLLLALIVEDVLIISQHTHIPMECSDGRDVIPHAAQDQERFTRSLRLPRWASRIALHFDAHELHHMYPFVPGYRLHDINYTPVNEVNWMVWTSAARAIPGETLFFQNRNATGFDL